MISTLMVGLLFAANCLAIACWECESDRHQNFESLATRSPTVRRWLPFLIFIQAIFASCLFAFGLLPFLVASCLISSDVLLMGLVLFRDDARAENEAPSPPPERLRFRVALADVTLVIPPIAFASVGVGV